MCVFFLFIFFQGPYVDYCCTGFINYHSSITGNKVVFEPAQSDTVFIRRHMSHLYEGKGTRQSNQASSPPVWKSFDKFTHLEMTSTRFITSKKHAYRPETSYVLYYSLKPFVWFVTSSSTTGFKTNLCFLKPFVWFVTSSSTTGFKTNLCFLKPFVWFVMSPINPITFAYNT